MKGNSVTPCLRGETSGFLQWSHYYFGYKNLPPEGMVKLFDIQADAEEMTDLSQAKKTVADELLARLKDKLQAVNRPDLGG